jgi:hypothetical protein
MESEARLPHFVLTRFLARTGIRPQVEPGTCFARKRYNHRKRSNGRHVLRAGRFAWSMIPKKPAPDLIGVETGFRMRILRDQKDHVRVLFNAVQDSGEQAPPDGC